jgi:phosphoribosylformylglycinamidine synthase
MASAEFDDEALEQRPTVQVGDPFLEKLLLEACLEAMKTGAVVGIQDMGAAGLTCSSCEMGSRGRAGIEMNLDAVPQREKGMSAYEIMLSESQERMLLVVRSGREREIIDIFKRWDLDAVVIGRVTNTGKVVVRQGEEVVADLPTELLTDEAPVYHRPLQAPTSDNDCIERLVGPVDLLFRGGSEGEDYSGLVRVVLTSPNIASRQWVFEQYDHMVRTNTVSMMGIDAAVIRVKETRLGIALTTDGNGRYCSLNPREGAKLAVAEAARNLACVGARPLAITNCLNFASPERPEVMWEFKETIEGMAEACHAFNTPVTGGNVSFYNETEGKGIYPTPVIGMVGLVEEADAVMTPWFKHEGDFVVLFGEGRADMGGTEIMNHLLKEVKGPVPSLDLAKERSVQALCVEAIQRSLIKSAHDCSDGGLVVSLAECCFSSYGRAPRGVEINAQFELENVHESWWPMIFLFSESPSRILASVDPADLARLQELAANRGVSLTTLGRVMGESLRISLNGDLIVDHPVADLERGWRSSLARVLG